MEPPWEGLHSGEEGGRQREGVGNPNHIVGMKLGTCEPTVEDSGTRGLPIPPGLSPLLSLHHTEPVLFLPGALSVFMTHLYSHLLLFPSPASPPGFPGVVSPLAQPEPGAPPLDEAAVQSPTGARITGVTTRRTLYPASPIL